MITLSPPYTCFSRRLSPGVRLIAMAILSIAFSGGCSPSAREVSRTVSLMGTFVQVKAVAGRKAEARYSEAVNKTISMAAQLEKRFSAYDPLSEVNELNMAGKAEVSPELYGLLKLSVKVSELTEGAFDISISPVLKENGFYSRMPREVREMIPDSTDGVDWKNIVLYPDGRTVELKNGAWVDLSGIAKGYIVDKMAEHMENLGVEEYLINAGGEIRCGARPDGWRIGVRRPGGEGTVGILKLGRAAVATSGDYENYIESYDGENVSHITDPGSGTQMIKTTWGVTVIAEECAYADALATGMMVMGGKRALVLAEELEGVEAIVVSREGRGWEVTYTSGSKELLELHGA